MQRLYAANNGQIIPTTAVTITTMATPETVTSTAPQRREQLRLWQSRQQLQYFAVLADSIYLNP